MNSEQALRTAERIASVVLKVLNNNVDSIILHGSLTLGAYEPGRSDIDLLVVCGSSLDKETKPAVLEAVTDLVAPVSDSIDLRFTSCAIAAAPPRFPSIDLEIAAHPPHNKLQIVADDSPDTDLLNEFAICRAHGRALHGLDPNRVIGEVPRSWLLEIGDEQLAKFQREHATGPFSSIVPLTACRIWRYADEGVYCSKHEAARWVLQRMPHCRIVMEALLAHEGKRNAGLDVLDLSAVLERSRAAVAEALLRS